MSTLQTMKWLIKREIWEHKNRLIWAPIWVGVILAGLSIMSVVVMANDGSYFGSGNSKPLAVVAVEKATLRSEITAMYVAPSLPILFLMAFTTFFYCAAALFDERKDRSVLFWKSMPISDHLTVTSKVLIALVIAPTFNVIVGLMTALACFVIFTIPNVFSSYNLVYEILTNAVIYEVPLKMIAILPVYTMWALPTVGWLLMVSAWSKSNALLWGIGTPIFAFFAVNWVAYFAKIDSLQETVRHIHFERLLTGTVPGTWLVQDKAVRSAFTYMFDHNQIASIPSMLLTKSWEQFQSPNIWIGAAVGVLMIIAAIRIRRWRDEG